jgi:hypothetical protein
LKREFGDFQTPPELVVKILGLLRRRGVNWSRVIEPTCGTGVFIQALLNSGYPPKEIVGFEIQADHAAETSSHISASSDVRVIRSGVFDVNFAGLDWKTDEPLLVIGNPPWITNSELGRLGSSNLPVKKNTKLSRGIDAITGASNFDLTEYILNKVVAELAYEKPSIAVLCKKTVACAGLSFAKSNSIPISGTIYDIDAAKWFKASVDACLFCAEVGREDSPDVPVYEDFEAAQPASTLRIGKNEVIWDYSGYLNLARFDGSFPFEWRQGVKHDAAKVLELSRPESVNRLSEKVTVESDYVYPLLKSSDLFHNRIQPRFDIIVPQKRIGEDTGKLMEEAPLLWAYLSEHRGLFRARKSRVYVKSPEFGIFGIGDYTFSRYKVAVAGLYAEPKFRGIGPYDDKPALLDDTCYFTPCDSQDRAEQLAGLLNHSDCAAFLKTLINPKAKRPVTKRILRRINLTALTAERGGAVK